MKSFSKSAAVLAGGLMFAGAASGAELLTNGGFESNNGHNGDNSGLGWTTVSGEDTALGFDVYSHATQVYYTGPAPTGAGDWYFHTVGLGSLLGTPAVVEQTVAVTGGGAFTLSANLAGGSYSDTAIIQMEFNDAANTIITLDGTLANSTDSNVDGSSPRDFAAWGLYSVTGVNPGDATSATVRILQATLGATNGNDNYVDNISLTDVPEPGSLALLGLGGLALLRRRR